MPSQINPNLINGLYPVAGQDNPTQGFRDNFTATMNNFTQAADEINDLINKVVVTAPLEFGATTGYNDLNGMPLTGFVESDFSLAVAALGTITTSGTVNIDYTAGYVQTITLDGNPAVTILNPINKPATGYYEFRLIVTVSNINHSLNLANFTNVNAPNIKGYYPNGKSINFYATGERTFIFGTQDGVNWDISELNTVAIATLGPPVSGIGNPGDRAGEIAYSNTNIYICTADYNGNTTIWYTASLTAL
jgi:hypothetical protein